MRRRLRRSNDAGYTVAEAVIAGSLMVLVVALVAPALMSPSQIASRTSTRLQMQEQMRTTVDPAIRLLRAAQPLGHCNIDGSSYTTPPDQCTGAANVASGSVTVPSNRFIEQIGPALVSGTAQRVCFYAQAGSAAAAASALAAPDLMCLEATTATPPVLQVTTWRASSSSLASYTTCAPVTSTGTGCWSSSPTVRFAGTLANSSVFTYVDAANNTIAAPVSAANLANVALIRARFELTAPTSGSASISTPIVFDYSASLRGVRYRSEQTP